MIIYDPQDGRTACEQAQAQNLRCHTGKGDIETLRTINKPAVLRLIDAQGKDYYLTITALQEKNATYSANGATQTGDINQLLLRWQGDYELLWRLPREYEDTLKPGGRGPFVMWLDSQLMIIDGKKPRSKPRNTYDEEMVKKVKAFQSSVGLTPDGIVDPTTVGHMIMKTGSEGPVLDYKKGAT
jgi:general secretion pathway protein A